MNFYADHNLTNYFRVKVFSLIVNIFERTDPFIVLLFFSIFKHHLSGMFHAEKWQNSASIFLKSETLHMQLVC